MLVHRAQTVRIELRLSGGVVFAHKIRDISGVASASPFAKARWNFENYCIDAAQAAFGRELCRLADEVFGPQMREKDRARQAGLPLEGACCSVCGVDQNTFPETAVYDTAGNLCETNGTPWVAPPEPLRWRCHVCDRLVCRNCTLVRKDVGQYYYHTYCSEACRAAAPPSFADDDEYML